VQTQYASLRDADLRSALLSIHIRRVAIQFARARFLSRSRGDNVVRSAAYNERIAITADRTGELFYFKHRDPPAHHEVLLPEGAANKFAASAVLWNTADLAEKRKDAQLAREIVLALPANAELTHEDRVTLARASRSSTSCPRVSRCSSTCTRHMKGSTRESVRTGTHIS
jgi:hypothetical protein